MTQSNYRFLNYVFALGLGIFSTAAVAEREGQVDTNKADVPIVTEKSQVPNSDEITQDKKTKRSWSKTETEADLKEQQSKDTTETNVEKDRELEKKSE
jgi:hypothetical protein